MMDFGFFGCSIFVGALCVMCLGGEVVQLPGEDDSVFLANTTEAFEPQKSLSFAEVLFEHFKLSYADNAAITGFTARDVVQLGRYYVHTTFGCITHCSSPDFNGVDGILGFGLPDAAVAGLRTPLFFALADKNRGYDRANDHILPSRQFTILANNERAELQLGGYDPDCCTQQLLEVQTTSDAEYSVPLESLKIGDTEVLQWTNNRVTSIPAIFDSGTSCIVIPDTLMAGVVTQKPYSTFIKHMQTGMSIYLVIKGRQFEIPFESWWLNAGNEGCIQASPPLFLGALLGDVVFRSLVVMFDLIHLHSVKIAVGQRKKDYELVHPGSSHSTNGVHRVSMIRKGRNGGIFVESPYRKHYGADRVPMQNFMDTQFFINVSVGTPRQTLTVIFDTGSSVFAVFCKNPHAHGNGPLHVYLPKFIPSSFLQLSQHFHTSHSHSLLIGGIAALMTTAVLLVVIKKYRLHRKTEYNKNHYIQL